MSLVFYGELTTYRAGNDSGGGIGHGNGCGDGCDFFGNVKKRIYGERDEHNGGELTAGVITSMEYYYGCGTLENCGNDRGGGQGQLIGFTTGGYPIAEEGSAPGFVAV